MLFDKVYHEVWVNGIIQMDLWLSMIMVHFIDIEVTELYDYGVIITQWKEDVSAVNCLMLKMSVRPTM